MNNLNVNGEYRVNLEVFEGPFDLLLYLIKKNDLDVYDIPIAFVLEEYMRYLDTLKDLDIDLAGDFLLMAAEMAHIKSRMLLPEDSVEEEILEDDPRADLVRRILEYQQFKEASEDLTKRDVLGRDVFVQQALEKMEVPDNGSIEGNVYELVEAFSKILQKIPASEYHAVAVDRISVNERIYQIIGRIKKGMTIMLEDLLVGNLGKYDVVVTFLALLEMSKLRMIKIYQSAVCGPIHIQGAMEDVREEDVARLIEVETAEHEKQPGEDK